MLISRKPPSEEASSVLGAGRVGREGAEFSTGRRIEEAALRLFSAKGFEATGIRELAEAAGIASSALYHYVGSKHELLVRLMTTNLVQLAAVAERALASAGDPPSRLGALVRTHVGFHAADPLRSRVTDEELRALTAASRAEIMDLRDRYEALWADVLEDGARSGQFVCPDRRIARLALLEMCNGVARWYSPSGPLTAEEVSDHMVGLALAMVQARRGRIRVGTEAVRAPSSGEIMTEILAELRGGATEMAWGGQR